MTLIISKKLEKKWKYEEMKIIWEKFLRSKNIRKMRERIINKI
jgi:hypothetical protein